MLVARAPALRPRGLPGRAGAGAGAGVRAGVRAASTTTTAAAAAAAKRPWTPSPAVMTLMARNAISADQARAIPATGPNHRLLKGDVLAWLRHEAPTPHPLLRNVGYFALGAGATSRAGGGGAADGSGAAETPPDQVWYLAHLLTAPAPSAASPSRAPRGGLAAFTPAAAVVPEPVAHALAAALAATWPAAAETPLAAADVAVRFVSVRDPAAPPPPSARAPAYEVCCRSRTAPGPATGLRDGQIWRADVHVASPAAVAAAAAAAPAMAAYVKPAPAAAARAAPSPFAAFVKSAPSALAAPSASASASASALTSASASASASASRRPTLLLAVSLTVRRDAVSFAQAQAMLARAAQQLAAAAA
ncbi:hypothetical protein CXG81DRAFT_28656 [Caulochytrium protostelioides]|uniref:Peripheral subunit-binding (PSBD) domain-containing protein n=1 Tax=Caulochytrium protostelioides TaxID=1555241 RepID=A0A4P9X0T4_9FUNG|nr:hypothetical protein CXG81DRAFT_28656 [Caulochytrium protostelioides]|eukprot:RKO98525.1 hypothetical protein CXG81DRAFT_28656 [Caulochytrium protostelioides]